MENPMEQKEYAGIRSFAKRTFPTIISDRSRPVILLDTGLRFEPENH